MGGVKGTGPDRSPILSKVSAGSLSPKMGDRSYHGPMRLITGTGLAVFVAFVVGLSAGVWWLVIGAIVATLAWSTIVDRTPRWTKPKGWYRG
jgi:hypothetical protein